MSLQIGDAIGDGVRRAFTKSGGVLMALLFAYTLVFLSATYALFLEYLPAEAQESGQFGLALPVSPGVAATIMAVALLFGIVIYLVAVRALVRDPSELSSFPSELYTRRIARATVSMIGANIVVQIAVTIGFVLLLVPGIFLAVSFIFVSFAIAVEDRRAIDSLSRSWELASGNRWSLFALGVLFAVAAGVIGAVTTMFTLFDPLVGEVVSLAVMSVLSVAGYGILADAYVQLRDAEGAGGSGGTESPDATGTAV